MNPPLKYFDISEFACHCGTPHDFKMDPVLLMRVDQLRGRFGKPLRVTSGYRCKKHNASEAVKGAPNSLHLFGMAVDLACERSEDQYELVKIAMSLGFTGIGIAKTFIHLDTRLLKKGKLWTY